ncbi:MAG: choice-of-anchor tandem repeat GloVer-containing protein, partial [Candidatus Korobacteraceae bacterium]
APAQGGDLYDNGPTNGTNDAYFIDVYQVSDQFPTSSGMTGFSIAEWVPAGATPLTFDWQVGSTSFGNDLGSGVVSIGGGGNGSAILLCTNGSPFNGGVCAGGFGYDVYQISVTGLSVTSGSNPYLTLTGTTDSFRGRDAWDINSGPSLAYHNLLGAVPSESFTIDGNGTASECIYDKPPNFRIIHSFTDQEGGPSSGVAADKAENLYGSAWGGDYLQGLLYKLAQSAAAWVLNPLYSFAGGGSGEDPGQPIIGPNGSLYGGTGGGTQNCGSDGTSYCGLVYNLRPPTNVCRTVACSWTETPLYDFGGNTDAWGGGVNGFDQAGNLYGTSSSGGAYGQGAVYELTPSPGGWTEKILYSFTGGSDGAQPNGVLIGKDGTLYGTASSGGDLNCFYNPNPGCGTVFRLVPSADGWTETVIYTFTDNGDGDGPSTLVQDRFGNLYGLSGYERCDCTYCAYFGLLFELSYGNWEFSVLQDSQRGDNCTNTFHDLAIDATGDLYLAGGGYDFICIPHAVGYVYDLGGRVGVGFQGDNFGNLALDKSGNVYGTTGSCGAYENGTVWKLSGYLDAPLHRENRGASGKGGVCQRSP